MVTNFRRARFLASISLCSVFLAALPAPAGAQSSSRSGVYATGSVLIDIKRFSGDPDENVLDGESAGVALALGTAVASRWDLEIGLELPAATDTVRERSIILGRSTVDIESITTNRAINVDALVRFRPARHGRVQVGYLAGLSLLSLRQHFETTGPDDVPASIIPRPLESIDYSAAPTIGIDAQIDMGAHLAIVPALRVTPFRARDESGLLLRPHVGVRWMF